MSVKLVFLVFAAVVYQANGQFQFPFGNGGFNQGGGIFPFLSMFRPPSIRPPSPINLPFFGGNQGGNLPSFFLPFLQPLRPRPPFNPNYEPVNQPIRPPVSLEDVHPPEYVTPEEIESGRPTFPQSRPDSFEVSEPVAIVEISEPNVSEEAIVAVPALPQEEQMNVSEENLFQIPEEQSEENIFDVVEEEDLEEEDIQDIQNTVDENEIQVPLVSPSVEIEEELPQELPEEFIR